jgi:hypothetical protein
MTGKLPSVSCALVERQKITEYLLNLAHEQGASKARFFLGRGFSLATWSTFGEALVAQGANNLVTKVTQTDYGMRYQVDCHCPTPDGTNPCIRTVWEIAQDGRCPRLLTAHPLKNP